MKATEKKLNAAFRLILLFGAYTVLLHTTLLGQDEEPVGPPKPVVVANTPANPVPVSGVVTGSVTITGEPVVKAKQEGAWSVGINGTPTVHIGNQPDAPVPIRDIENPARQPFQLSYDTKGGDLPNVPAGKLFVIEYLSGSVQTETPIGETRPCRLLRIGFGSRPSFPTAFESHFLSPQYLGDTTGIGGVTVSFYSIGQAVRIYMGPNQIPARFAFAGPVCGPTTFEGRVTLSGHLVDVP